MPQLRCLRRACIHGTANAALAPPAQPSAAAAPADRAKDAPAKPKGGKVLPTQAFRTDRWRDMDADVSLDAGRIVHDSKLPLSDLTVHVVLQDGKLR
ncbi:hypothetical protein G6F62_015470 [Rhizopus arrhizus]|nr:hypothetical protein G6F62_015470 [Rhizopus arrhizus]